MAKHNDTNSSLVIANVEQFDHALYEGYLSVEVFVGDTTRGINNDENICWFTIAICNVKSKIVLGIYTSM